MSVDPVFAHQLPERPTILPCRLSRFGNVPLVGKKDPLDVGSLELGDGLRFCFLERILVCRGSRTWQDKVSLADDRLLREHDGLLDDVFELPYITWPFIEHKHLYGFCGEARHMLVELSGVLR